MNKSEVSPLTTEHQAFHAHLDICEQCRERPFDLCRVGDALLRNAVQSLGIYKKCVK